MCVGGLWHVKYVVTHRVPHAHFPKLNPSKTPSGRRLSPHTGSESSPMSSEGGPRSARSAGIESASQPQPQAQARGRFSGTQNMPRPLASLTKLYGTFWPTSSLSVSTVANAAVSATP